MYGPSYFTAQTALSYLGLIPERTELEKNRGLSPLVIFLDPKVEI